MAYRDETDPLKAKEAVLSSELATLRRREREVSRELDETRATLRKERALPMLEDVRIASPCSADWEEMVGDARVRFCGKCAKNVYNLSEMTRDEAESLLAENEGERCVRLYQRADGTVITNDCAVGAKRKRVRRYVALYAAAFGASGAALASAAQPVLAGSPSAFHPSEKAGPQIVAHPQYPRSWEAPQPPAPLEKSERPHRALMGTMPPPRSNGPRRGL